jgi:hypothetical protein
MPLFEQVAQTNVSVSWDGGREDWKFRGGLIDTRGKSLSEELLVYSFMQFKAATIKAVGVEVVAPLFYLG